MQCRHRCLKSNVLWVRPPPPVPCQITQIGSAARLKPERLRVRIPDLAPRETGSIGRAPDSKPGITEFESLVSRQVPAPEGNRQASGPQPRAGQFNSDPVLQVWKMPLRGWQLVLKTRDTFGYVVRLRHLPPFFS